MAGIRATDVETESLDPSMKLHAALEPWRVRQGKARITSIAMCMPDDSVQQIENHGGPRWADHLIEFLEPHQGEVVYAHNAVFDLAFIIASTTPNRCGKIHDVIRNIKWRDTSLLTKWCINGQLAETSFFKYNLVNLVKTFLPDHPLAKDFIAMKEQNVNAGENPEYWLKRGQWDVILTRALAEFMQGKLAPEQRTGFLTEQDCLVPVANSWITGIRIDQAQLKLNERHFLQVRADAAKKLGVDSDIFTSTKRLPDLIFNRWGLPVISRTPKGAPQCNSDVLKLLEYKMLQEGDEATADKLKTIMKAKEACTLHSKYVKSMIEALAHTRDGYIYPAPKIFGTYTGRFTYSSTVNGRDFEEDKGKRFKVSIAAHQIPRKDKMVRSSLCPPPGYEIYEADASGQESRIMAIRANDPVMIEIFQKDLNFHSMTGSAIIGMDYNEFQAQFKAEGNDGGYYTEQRQLGKLTNLSCNFRIGGRALSSKAFLDYDTYMTIETGNFLVNTFARRYVGVPQYWEDVIWQSKQDKYTETLGGRRYKLTDWGTHRWITESSAINVPIQGTGADMKEIAIKETFEKVPEAIFVLDLHDANFFFVPEGMAAKLHERLDDVLNGIDYEKYWGFQLPIALPYESKRGKTFAEVK
jgi:DNA polymerase I-like protein with 3'-5' exonuclease and polymerase domains